MRAKHPSTSVTGGLPKRLLWSGPRHGQELDDLDPNFCLPIPDS